MRYLIVLFFITGCSAIQKKASRNNHNFDAILLESKSARKTLSDFISNPDSFVGLGADRPKRAVNQIFNIRSSFQTLCGIEDQEACNELKLGEEAVNDYKIKIAEITKNESELNEAKRKAEAERYEAEQKKINERDQRYEAIGGNDLRNICLGEGNIKHFNRVIAEQKAIGKESGVVNQTALYQAGQGLVTWRKILAESKVEYKKKMKKEFQPSACSLLEKSN